MKTTGDRKRKCSTFSIMFFIFAAVMVVVWEVSGQLILFRGMALKWHILNENVISFHNMKLELPLRWWVSSNDKETLILAVALPSNKDPYSFIYFKKELIHEKELVDFIKDKKKYGEDMTYFERRFESQNIGTIKAFGVVSEFKKHDDSNNSDYNFELWTLPTKKLTIFVDNFPKKYRNIFLELLSHISFRIKDRGIMNEKKLIKGNHYYRVAFYDQKLTIPEITTLIYIGKNLCPDDNKPTIDEWYFQDPESYLAHGAFTDFKDKIGREMCIYKTLESIYDDQSLIDTIKLLQNLKKKGLYLAQIRPNQLHMYQHDNDE